MNNAIFLLPAIVSFFSSLEIGMNALSLALSLVSRDGRIKNMREMFLFSPLLLLTPSYER